MTRRPVVTGLGATTALGRGVSAFWDGLLSGRSGFRPVTLFPVSRYVARNAAAIAEVPEDPEGELVLRAHLFARAAAEEALEDSGLFFGGERDALVLGTTLAGNEAWTDRLAGASRGGAPLSGAAPASVTRLLARRWGVRGPALTVSVACASGTAAVGIGAELIRRGEADRVLAGGADALSEFVFSGFDALRALSPTAARPFDRRRDGLGLGEGAGFVVLEEESAARARGARVLARVAGYASAGDGHHMTRPSPGGEGIVRATRAALCQAHVLPEDVGFVNAHGTATTFNDRMEANAFAALFGPRAGQIPVDSIKGAIGHTLGAAGALEAVTLALVLARGVIPPTCGFKEADPDCPLDVVTSPRPFDGRVAISTSSAFAGTNACLVMERA
ncbi:MAG TPA: beta-ketoacyl-[acyl-carrier-protein] synthase family protein [Thermoanaerobaculia bacterium]|nr:beta-ketoacyl-[acyl-carrier-protein] synthase family protein [Thermoanaerobaculia bacterium]